MTRINLNFTSERVIPVILILLFVILGLGFTKCKASTINKDSVFHYAKAIGVLYPDICTAQSIHESGNYTSYGFKVRHNLFGFKNLYGYKHFHNWKESIDFYKVFQERRIARHHCNSHYGWLRYISTHFATDPHYGRKIARTIHNTRLTPSYLTNLLLINPITDTVIMRKPSQTTTKELVCQYSDDTLVLSSGYNLPTKAEIKAIVVVRPKIRVEAGKAAEYSQLSILIEKKVNLVRAKDQELKGYRLSLIRKSTNNINTMFDRLMNMQENDFVIPYYKPHD